MCIEKGKIPLDPFRIFTRRRHCELDFKARTRDLRLETGDSNLGQAKSTTIELDNKTREVSLSVCLYICKSVSL